MTVYSSVVVLYKRSLCFSYTDCCY